MNLESELIESHEQWAENLDHPLPEHLNLTAAAPLPPGLGELMIRLGIQRLPSGPEHHFNARLADSLLDVMRHGAKELAEPLLPPHSADPLDWLFARKTHGHEWGEPFTDLTTPLWVVLAQGYSRRFGIEYRLAVRINTKWRIAAEERMTPKQLLSSFGFDPNDYSLYRENSSHVLPPDTPIHLKRGEHFEAQKDGRYGLRAAAPRGLQTIDDDVASVTAGGVDAGLISENGQRFVEVSGLEIPSPPWSGGAATIAIAVPTAYPQGGLDGFYLEKTVNQNGSVPYAQATATVIGGRAFVLISWHYVNGREWNPSRDDLASHIAHCRGYFLKRGVR
jgi:hypothetical protein